LTPHAREVGMCPTRDPVVRSPEVDALTDQVEHAETRTLLEHYIVLLELPADRLRVTSARTSSVGPDAKDGLCPTQR
jgi:hypothetical protein